MRTLAISALLLVSSATALASQAPGVRVDPATGDYLVTIYDDDLQPREIRITPGDQIEVEVASGVRSAEGGAVLYQYSVRVLEGSRRTLGRFEVDCPSDAQFQAMEASVPWEGEIDELFALHDGGSCKVLLGALPVPAGNPPLSLSFETDLLPAVGVVRAVGAVGAVRWPTFDPIPENAVAARFIRSINGSEGGWRTVTGVVPAREPDAFDDPAGGLALLEADLSQACGELGWITNRGICRSLQAKLDAASRAVTRQRPNAARGPLGAFLQELDAQHGPEPGKHVSDEAYALLRVNAERLLDAL